MEAQYPRCKAAVQPTLALVDQMSVGDWIGVAATLVTAFGVLWGIFQHISAQKLSAKLEVLDRRRSIYDRLRDVLLELTSCGDDIQSVWVHAFQLYIDSEHLFRADVRGYLKAIADKLAHLSTVRTELRHCQQTGDQAAVPELVHKSREMLDWLYAQHEGRSSVFADYLRLP